MTEIAATNNPLFGELSIANKREVDNGGEELGQSAFLELMITQLKHQDPLSPQDNGEFIAQLAQFSSVESLDKLNDSFDSFANSFVSNQALQASSLVGRSVSVSTDVSRLDNGGIVSASVDIPQSTGDVTVNIYGESGALVDQVSLGQQPSGELVFRWDGMNIEVNGDILDWQSSQENGAMPGMYRFEVMSSVDGEATELNTALSANVNSVTVGADGTLTLNLDGVGPVSLADIKQFNE